MSSRLHLRDAGPGTFVEGVPRQDCQLHALPVAALRLAVDPRPRAEAALGELPLGLHDLLDDRVVVRQAQGAALLVALQALGQPELHGGGRGEHDQRVAVLAVPVELRRAEAGLAQCPLHQLGHGGCRAVQYDAAHRVRGAVAVQHGERAVREARVGNGGGGLLRGRASRLRRAAGRTGGTLRRGRGGGGLCGVGRLGRAGERAGYRSGLRRCRGGQGGGSCVDGALRRPPLEQPLIRLQARRLRLGAAVLPVLHRLGRRLQGSGEAGLGDSRQPRAAERALRAAGAEALLPAVRRRHRTAHLG